MSKNTSLVLIIWNILLTGLVGWGLFKNASQHKPSVADDRDESTEMVEPVPITPRDPDALKEAHIAFFYMDSVQKKYELIAEKDKRFRTEGQRLESSLQNEMAKAQARYQELMEKDHTYSTQAEVAKDEQELQGLMQRIQGQQARSEEQLAKLEGWTLSGEGPTLVIEKTYHFANYYQTIAFVNALAFIAHVSDHHPDLSVSYNRCVVRFNTHDVQGISETDFQCATAVDSLLA